MYLWGLNWGEADIAITIPFSIDMKPAWYTYTLSSCVQMQADNLLYGVVNQAGATPTNYPTSSPMPEAQPTGDYNALVQTNKLVIADVPVTPEIWADNSIQYNMTIPHVGWKVCTLTRQLRVELFTSYLPLITVNKNPQAQTTTVPVPNAYPPPEPPATVVPLPYP